MQVGEVPIVASAALRNLQIAFTSHKAIIKYLFAFVSPLIYHFCRSFILHLEVKIREMGFLLEHFDEKYCQCVISLEKNVSLTNKLMNRH